MDQETREDNRRIAEELRKAAAKTERNLRIGMAAAISTCTRWSDPEQHVACSDALKTLQAELLTMAGVSWLYGEELTVSDARSAILKVAQSLDMMVAPQAE